MCNANNVCDICQQDSDCTQMGVFTYCGTNWWGEDRTCGIITYFNFKNI